MKYILYIIYKVYNNLSLEFKLYSFTINISGFIIGKFGHISIYILYIYMYKYYNICTHVNIIIYIIYDYIYIPFPYILASIAIFFTCSGILIFNNLPKYIYIYNIYVYL